MPIQREFNGVKYDCFYGRAFNILGGESYVSLDLASEGLCRFKASSESLYHMVKDLCRDMREGRRILLDKSPGYLGDPGSAVLFFVPLPRVTWRALERISEGVLDGDLLGPDILLKKKDE